MGKQTIFIAVDQGFAARYLLRTDIFKVLINSRVRIVILTPNADEDYLLKEFSDKNVYIERLNEEAYSTYRNNAGFFQNFFREVRWYVMNDHVDLHTVNMRYDIYKKTRANNTIIHKIYNYIFDCTVVLLRQSGWLRKLLIVVESKLFTPSVHAYLFQKYRPDKLVVSSLGYLGFDHYLMREAEKYGAKIISVILSWDNTSSKGMPGAQADHVIAWTEAMKKELVDYSDVNSQRIFVGGVAHFDYHVRKDHMWPKDKLFEYFGLDPERKLIFFAPKSPNKFPWNPDIVEFIAQLIGEGAIKCPCQLLVRLHPLNFRTKDGEFRFTADTERHMSLSSKYDHLVYDVPEIVSKTLPMDMPLREMFKIGSILQNADVLLSYFSTMMLEASIFDLPIINVALYPHTDRLDEGDLQVMDSPHIRRILQTGGVRTVFTRQQVIDAINTYLENPSLDMDGRNLIRAEECGRNLGRAGRTIGEKLLQY
jgi:hypothetical protein